MAVATITNGTSVQLAHRFPDGEYTHVAGCVIARQRPGTAKGFVFLSLEDETEISNVIVNPDLYEKYRKVINREKFLRVEGVLQNQDNVISIKASRVMPVSINAAETESHDFHLEAKSEWLRAREVEQQLHVVFVCVERAQRGEVPRARIARGDEIFSSAPGEFRLAALNGDDVGDHSRMTPVSIREGMDSRQLVMKAKQCFVGRERFVLQAVSCVGEKLGNSLHDLFRVAADV